MIELYTQEQIAAHLVDHDYRPQMLAELRLHLTRAAPPKLAAYFVRRIECLLVSADRSPHWTPLVQRSLESLEYDFGYMGYFDRVLGALKGLAAPQWQPALAEAC